MIQLTPQERKALVFVTAAVFFGAVFRYALTRYPDLHDLVNLMESDSLYYSVDVNRASKEELVRIPYIGEYTAEKIIARRKSAGAFSSVEEISGLPGIYKKNYDKFSKYLTVKD